jgi:uroporphyrin-III C-methyltransferase
MKKQPKLTLIGAGPGDPDLISVKGLKALAAADVVLYGAGNHARTQDEINQLIIDFAFSHGHVVRLKGGDSFVFGRGFEEMEYALQFGIETEVIPGITSAIAVPALHNIPVTKRGVSESFWVITGSTSDGRVSDDVKLAAQSNSTIVILMGLGKLNEIAGIFKEAGKAALPVAVIQSGSLPKEKIATGTIETIEQEVAEKELKAPAIIVIGEVVKLAKSDKSIENLLKHNSIIS